MPRTRRVAGAATRVLGYARVSSEEQARGSSLRDQQEAIRLHAASRGLTVAAFYVEAASAVHDKFERRTEMQRLMRDARAGDLIVCDKLDRWSRDAEFSYRSVRELLAKGCSMYFVSDRIDPSTNDGDSAMSFRILFAREEHKRIKERMCGTRVLLRDQGYWAEGPPPFGYRRQGGRGPEKNVLVLVPEEAAIVRQVFRLAIGGKSLAQIMPRVNLGRDRVADILRRRAYVGQIENSRGEWIDARVPPIIDMTTFLRAREAVAGRLHGGPRPSGRLSETSTWVLRDVSVCGLCGARMGAAYAGPHEARRYYYRCVKRCTTRFVPVRLVERAFEPMLLERLAELRDGLAREPVEAAPAPADTGAAKRARLETKRARYLEMYADGILERATMLERVRLVDAELLRLAAPAPARSPLAEPAVRRAALRDLATLEAAWRRGAPEKRRALVGDVVLRVGLVADDPPAPVWRTIEDLAQTVE